jgi:hypothetical protein
MFCAERPAQMIACACAAAMASLRVDDGRLRRP